MLKLAVLIFLAINLITAQEWNYGDKGEDYWPFLFNKCNGKFQSPVNIFRLDARFNEALRKIQVDNIDRLTTFKVENRNFTVIFTPNEDQPKPVFRGSNFGQNLTLVQFHFHWGENDFQGSEHYIDGFKFPAEVHFVTKSDNGTFAVFAFLFKLNGQDNPSITSLINGIASANALGPEVRFHDIQLSSVLPQTWTDYYRYVGSLTTPPCTENIIWNVFKEIIPISSAQLQAFRMNQVKKNFREPQRRFRRRVEKSFLGF